MNANDTQKHTPGPWTAAGPGIRETAGKDPRIMVLHPDGVRLIATTHEGCTRPDGATICKDEQRANARLIAAAPELLEALRESETALTELLCSRELDSTRQPFHAVRDARDRMRAAIAKAEGGDA